MQPVAILSLYDNFSWAHGQGWIHNTEDWYSEEGFVQDPILMQYTGLKDKNGKEIYEGDILEGSSNGLIYGHGLKLVMEWDEDTAGYWLEMRNPKFKEYAQAATRMTIIGNIYENADLVPTELIKKA